MLKRKKIELKQSNSVLEFIIDENGKILYVKKEELLEDNTLKVKGYGKIIPNNDIKFSNLKMPPQDEGYILRFQYEYNKNDVNKAKVGYVIILDNEGNIYSQENLLDYSSIITIEEGKKIIKNTIPILENNIEDSLSEMVGTNIKSVNKIINKPKISTFSKIKARKLEKTKK